MLADPAREIDRFDQFHAHDVGVEIDRPCHVLTHQRNVIEASNIEFTVGIFHCTSSSYLAGSIGYYLDYKISLFAGQRMLPLSTQLFRAVQRE
jgi:hypothetical protein